MALRDFNKDLQYSLEHKEDRSLNDFYKRTFLEVKEIETMDFKNHAAEQLKGIDKKIYFNNGQVITIDEKKRKKDYGDIYLELTGNSERRKKGWLYTCNCDYIVYYIPINKKVYLLPTLLLKAAWKKYKSQWINNHRMIHSRTRAGNKYYTTVGIAIPNEIIFAAIQEQAYQKYN